MNAANEAIYSLRNEVSKYAVRYLESLFSGGSDQFSHIFEILSTMNFGDVVPIISVSSNYLTPYNDPNNREELYDWIMKCFTARPFSQQSNFDIDQYILSFKPPRLQTEQGSKDQIEEIALAFSLARKSAERFLTFFSQMMTPMPQFMNPEPSQYLQKPSYEWGGQMEFPQGFENRGAPLGSELGGVVTGGATGVSEGAIISPAAIPAQQNPKQDMSAGEKQEFYRGIEYSQPQIQMQSRPQLLQNHQQQGAMPPRDENEGAGAKTKQAVGAGNSAHSGDVEMMMQMLNATQGKENPGSSQFDMMQGLGHMDLFKQPQDFGRFVNHKSPSPSNAATGDPFDYAFDEIFSYQNLGGYPENGGYIFPVQPSVPNMPTMPSTRPSDGFFGSTGPNEDISRFNYPLYTSTGAKFDGVVSPPGVRPEMMIGGAEDEIVSNEIPGYKKIENEMAVEEVGTLAPLIDFDLKKRCLLAPAGENITFLTSVVLSLWYMEPFRTKILPITRIGDKGDGYSDFFRSFRAVLHKLASSDEETMSVKRLRESIALNTTLRDGDGSAFPLDQKDPSCVKFYEWAILLLHEAVSQSNNPPSEHLVGEIDAKSIPPVPSAIYDVFGFHVEDNVIERAGPGSQKARAEHAVVYHHRLNVDQLLQFRSKYKSDTFDGLLGRLFAVQLKKEGITKRRVVDVPNIMSLSLEMGPSPVSQELQAAEKILNPLLSALSPHIDMGQVYPIRNTQEDDSSENQKPQTGRSYHCASAVCIDLRSIGSEIVHVSFSWMERENQWILFDCKEGEHRAIGSRWGDLISLCKKSKYFPAILYFTRGPERSSKQAALPGVGTAPLNAWGLQNPASPIPLATGSDGERKVDVFAPEETVSKEIASERSDELTKPVANQEKAGYSAVVNDRSSPISGLNEQAEELALANTRSAPNVAPNEPGTPPSDGNIPLDRLEISHEEGIDDDEENPGPEKERLLQGLHGDTRSAMQSLQEFISVTKASNQVGKEIDMDRVIREANTVCPNFLMGECTVQNCGFYHPNNLYKAPEIHRVPLNGDSERFDSFSQSNGSSRPSKGIPIEMQSSPQSQRGGRRNWTGRQGQRIQ